MWAAWTGCRAIWLRDMVVFRRTWLGPSAMIGQPVLYLLVLGTGLDASMRLVNAPAGLDYVQFMYPGVIGMSVLFTSIFSALSIIWDREFGFLREVLIAPVPRWAVALGKVLGGATVATLQVTVLLLLAPVVGVTLTLAAAAGILAFAFLSSVALTALGVAIAARMASMQSYQIVLNFLLMPMYFLSDAMFPMATAPHWMQAVMRVNPLSYAVDGFRTLALAHTPAAAGSRASMLEVAREAALLRGTLALDAAVLAAFAAVLLVIAAVRFEARD